MHIPKAKSSLIQKHVIYKKIDKLDFIEIKVSVQ